MLKMGLFNNWQLWIIRLVCWLGWFSSFALAQFDLSEGATAGYATFPVLGVTCFGNLAAFVTSLIRGRLDAEMGARDALDILLSSPELNKINGIENGNGLTTCGEKDEATQTEGNATETASAEGGVLHMEESAREIVSAEGGLRTEGEATQTASAEGGVLHMEESAREIASAEGGLNTERKATRFFKLFLQAFRLPFSSIAEVLPNKQTVIIKTEDLTTASVVMLSNGKPNWSIVDFVRYNSPIVDSILLQYLLLKAATNDEHVKAELTTNDEHVMAELTNPNLITVRSTTDANVTAKLNTECQSGLVHTCNCIVFWTKEGITSMLTGRMPGTLKRISDSLCLLPCQACLKNGCHDCRKENMLSLESPLPLEHKVTVSDPNVVSVPVSESNVVSEILDDISASSINAEEHICICVPMNDAGSDKWTQLLVRSLRSKDAETRGVRVNASEALDGYLAGARGDSEARSVDYNIVSFILPRFTEAVINGLLTLWFKVDGFSSSLIARRTIKDYVVDSKGSGMAASAFLTKALVKCDANKTQVCQVLTFRGSCLCIRVVASVVGLVNLASSVAWAVLISIKHGGSDSSQLPSKPRVTVITVAILIAYVMDCIAYLTGSNSALRSGRFFSAFREFSRNVGMMFLLSVILASCGIFIPYGLAILSLFLPRWMRSRLPLFSEGSRLSLRDPGLPMFLEMLILEVAAGITLGVLEFETGTGRHKSYWIYGALQALVWVKWAMGSYILNFEKSQEFLGKSPHTWGILVHSSAFMLNAVLAGVRCKWDKWPWNNK